MATMIADMPIDPGGDAKALPDEIDRRWDAKRHELLHALNVNPDRLAEADRIAAEAALDQPEMRSPPPGFTPHRMIVTEEGASLADLMTRFPIGMVVMPIIGSNAPRMLVTGWSTCDDTGIYIPSLLVFWLDSIGAPHRETLPAVAFTLVK